MSKLNFLSVIVILAGWKILCAAQSPTTQNADEPRSTPAPALSGVMGIDTPVQEEDTSGGLPRIPALLGGPGMSLSFLPESERSNYLRGGLNVAATYDDNALLTSSQPVGNTTYAIFPNISIQQTRSRTRWTLGYAAGLTVNQKLSNNNQVSQDLNFDSQFRLSPHVNLRVAEDFSLTSGFFDSGSGTVVSGTGTPNANIAAPLSRQRSSATVVEANYHFALKDMVGASGSLNDLHFSDVPSGFSLTNTRTAAGSAFWLHGLFGRDWAGLSYSFQRVTFGSSGETRVHFITAVNTITFSSGFAVTAFVGPEYSENQGLAPAGGSGQPSHFNDWSTAGGVDVGWQRVHTSVTAGYSRRISDGGGVLGVVRWQGVHGDVRQQVLPGWAVGVGVNYGTNDAVTVPSAGSATSIKTASVGASVERNIGRNVGLRFGYGHDFQDQIGSTDPNRQGGIHRNRIFVTLGYGWARPLGR